MSARVDWADLSERQMIAVMLLSFAMPVHYGYLTRRLKVTGRTVQSLVARGLARHVFYAEDGSRLACGFVSLTQQGERVRKDYIRWHKRVGAKIGHLPPAMAAVAKAPLS